MLGFSVADSESENSWSSLFDSLKKRGLKNVDYVVSDNHSGLVKALDKNFRGSTWQRCQTHFTRNMLEACPKKLRSEFKNWLRKMYDSKDIDDARETRDKIFTAFGAAAPKAVKLLDAAFDNTMAIMSLPEKYRKRLRTTNSIERLNQEIRRRERVIRIFPNRK